MLSLETEQKLSNLFLGLANGEKTICHFKSDIFCNMNLNPFQLFYLLTQNSKNYIEKSDIFDYLSSFNADCNQTDVEILFFFYDKDADGVLNFPEFLELLISDCNYMYKKTLRKKYKKNQMEVYKVDENVEKEAEGSLLQILFKEIDLARYLFELIDNIKISQDFDIEEIFYAIKSYNFITPESIKAFLDRNGVTYNEMDIKCIFKRMKNKEKEDKISFNKLSTLFDLYYQDRPQNPQNQVNYSATTFNNHDQNSQNYISNFKRFSQFPSFNSFNSSYVNDNRRQENEANFVAETNKVLGKNCNNFNNDFNNDFDNENDNYFKKACVEEDMKGDINGEGDEGNYNCNNYDNNVNVNVKNSYNKYNCGSLYNSYEQNNNDGRFSNERQGEINTSFNDDDIQFKCSHVSDGGSAYSARKEKIENFRRQTSNLSEKDAYVRYLRENRMRSLEKSNSKSPGRMCNLGNFGRGGGVGRKELFGERANMRRVEINSPNHLSDFSNTLNNEETHIKSPQRINKTLVLRNSPMPSNNYFNTMQNKGTLNENYENFKESSGENFVGNIAKIRNPREIQQQLINVEYNKCRGNGDFRENFKTLGREYVNKCRYN